MDDNIINKYYKFSIKRLNINIIEIILDYLFYGNNMKMENLIHFKNTCKMYFYIVQKYINKFISNKPMYNNIYKEHININEINETYIYVHINSDKKIVFEKEYIKIKYKNNIFYKYIYNIYINKLENLQNILSFNIFKEESLKNIIILHNVYEFHYIEKKILYGMTKSTIIKYFPIINYIFLCFRYENIYNKSLLNNIFSFLKNIKNINTLKIFYDESYKSLFIDDLLNYISVNNIKINV